MTNLQLFALGAAGALVPDLLKFINGRFEDPPPWIWSLYYWVAALLLALLGGVVACASQPDRVIDALAIGYAAPTIVASLLGKLPKKTEPEPTTAGSRVMESIRIAWGLR